MIPSHIKPLTGVRFIAALSVVVFHLRDKIAPLLGDVSFVNTAISWAYFAVPFFFILSGFILSHVYFPTYRLADHGRFMWLRFARLWPVHLAMTASLVLLAAVWILHKGHNPHTDQPFSLLLPDLLMIRSWYDDVLIWNVPSWSIQIEWFAYLFLFPVCAWLIRPLRNPWILGLLSAGLLMVHPVLIPLLPGHLGTIPCLFVAGSALYRLRAVLCDLACGHAIVYLALLGSVTTLTFDLPYLRYLSLAGIVFGLSYEQGFIARFLSTRALVYGGQISFSLYMSHCVVYAWTQELWDKIGVNGLGPVTAMFVAALVGSAVVYHWIEVPANRWLRHLLPEGKRQSETVSLSPSTS